MAKVHLGFHAGTAGKATEKTVQGLIRHTLRKTKKTKNHSNEDINKDNTKYNIDYKIRGKRTDEAIQDRLENDYKGKRKLRKDQVIIREVITQPSKEHFEGMTMEQKRDEMGRFMRDALPWFDKEFGKENVVGASAHLDETNPHGHIMILPMTDDGRVSQTDFFKGPKHLAAQHRSYREHMIARGWDFEKENKYEDVDEVDLPTYKANATKIEKGRKEQTEAIRGLLSDDEIRQEATEIVLNDVLREEREKMEKDREDSLKRQEMRNKTIQERENALQEQKMDFMKQLADVSRGYASEKSTEVLDGFVEQGYFIENKKTIRSVMNEVVQGAIEQGRVEELQQHSRVVQQQVDDDGPEL